MLLSRSIAEMAEAKTTWSCAVFFAIVALCAGGCRGGKQQPATAQKPPENTAARQETSNDAGIGQERKSKTARAAAQDFDEPVDPSKAPEEVKQMVKYLDEITSIIHKGMPECEKVARRLVEYTDKNRKKMVEIQKKLEQLSSQQAPEAALLGRYATALVMPAAMRWQRALGEFSTKCTTDAQKIGRMLEALGKEQRQGK